MSYTKIAPLGKRCSRGTFDDFFDTEKYTCIPAAWVVNDYVECDFVKDEFGIIYIECKHAQNPDVKKYHKLNYQHFPAGIDISDDTEVEQLAQSMFLK